MDGQTLDEWNNQEYPHQAEKNQDLREENNIYCKQGKQQPLKERYKMAIMTNHLNIDALEAILGLVQWGGFFCELYEKGQRRIKDDIKN